MTENSHKLIVPDSSVKAIEELVERFSRNKDQYRNPAYKEDQCRIEFINPFFEALGWDIANKQGFAEQYKEVIHEETLSVSGMTKAPDYSFRIGGMRKFFLEAKKPALSLKTDASPAFQLRRYAWSAKLSLSVLTDFAEFAVYDCRIKPSEKDRADTARVQYLTLDKYLSELEWIYGIFSKPAVLKGDFDRFIESKKAPGPKSEVDSEFLKEIERWREILAKNIALRNPRLEIHPLNDAVQRTIDRIVFLRIAEDRGIEHYRQLLGLINGVNIYKRLCQQVFYQAEDKYNSGLFDFQKDKFTTELKIDDKVLHDIIESLYYPKSPYEFSVLPAEILGNIYEQFLGKVIRLTASHQAKVEEKPEVKKAGGVYYTPKYIVDYIVKNTVGRLIEENLHRKVAKDAKISDFEPKTANEKPETAKGMTPQKISQIRILDPACGSGSFLLGAYQYLLDYHQKWYAENQPEKRIKEVYQGQKSQWLLTTQEKKRILLNNIFGVDIDPQAVEVTKLSLLLKVLENESEETLAKQLKLWKERALPDLDNNIKCGNSLIGTDFYQQQQASLFDDEQKYKINAFDWQSEFPEIFKPPRHNESKSIRGADTLVRTQTGFDIVIGNPPYGALFSDAEKLYLKSKYKYQSYQLDSYLLFLELSLNYLLRKDGIYGMIIPNPWLTNLLQKDIRILVTNFSRILEIAHFEFKVFQKVTVDNEIVILQKSDPKGWQATVKLFDSLEVFKNLMTPSNPKILIHNQEKWIALTGEVINIFVDPKQESLIGKIALNCIPLESIFLINVGIKPYQVGKGIPPQNRATVENRIFDSDRALNKFYRRYLRGRDIGRYRINPLEVRYIKYGEWLAEPRPAANFDAPSKIFMRQTGDSLIAALDESQYLCLNNMHVLVPMDKTINCKYILAILNSRLLNWYYQTLNPEVGEALAEVKKTNVARLPIKKPNLSVPSQRSLHDKMVELVSQMLDLRKRLAGVKTEDDRVRLEREIKATDDEIDSMVYKLYGLTNEEIGIIEVNNG